MLWLIPIAAAAHQNIRRIKNILPEASHDLVIILREALRRDRLSLFVAAGDLNGLPLRGELLVESPGGYRCRSAAIGDTFFKGGGDAYKRCSLGDFSCIPECLLLRIHRQNGILAELDTGPPERVVGTIHADRIGLADISAEARPGSNPEVIAGYALIHVLPSEQPKEEAISMHRFASIHTRQEKFQASVQQDAALVVCMAQRIVGLRIKHARRKLRLHRAAARRICAWRNRPHPRQVLNRPPLARNTQRLFSLIIIAKDGDIDDACGAVHGDISGGGMRPGKRNGLIDRSAVDLQRQSFSGHNAVCHNMSPIRPRGIFFQEDLIIDGRTGDRECPRVDLAFLHP